MPPSSVATKKMAPPDMFCEARLITAEQGGVAIVWCIQYIPVPVCSPSGTLNEIATSHKALF